MSEPVSPINPDSSRAQQAASAKSAMGVEVAQEESDESLQAFTDEGAFSPVVLNRRFETMETRRKRSSKEEEAEKSGKSDEKIVAVQRIEKAAGDVNKRNPELQSRALILLHSRLLPGDTKDDILRKVLELYPDPSLADEALDFLLEVTDGPLAEQARLAKDELNQTRGKEVRSGRNISTETKQFAGQGLGAAPQLRSLYRQVLDNPRDVHTLFNDFSSNFDYPKLKVLSSFLLGSLGSDLRSKGPSIDRGELHRLFTETRKLQAILGIYTFFESRMNLIKGAYEHDGISSPPPSFEQLAKQFMKAVQERYPAADKVLQLAAQLGISKDQLAQIILLTQMRDAMRQVAPKLFRSSQHRQDLLNAFMDAIEELDEQIEEDEEEEAEKKKKKQRDAP